jgi:hypothetical protein
VASHIILHFIGESESLLLPVGKVRTQTVAISHFVLGRVRRLNAYDRLPRPLVARVDQRRL